MRKTIFDDGFQEYLVEGHVCRFTWNPNAYGLA